MYHTGFILGRIILDYDYKIEYQNNNRLGNLLKWRGLIKKKMFRAGVIAHIYTFWFYMFIKTIS